jgi:hypothetical protein
MVDMPKKTNEIFHCLIILNQEFPMPKKGAVTETSNYQTRQTSSKGKHQR